jgi:hypothetical protein
MSGSPQGVPERDRMKTSWPSCSAATSEDPMVPGRYRVMYVIDGDVITIERVDRMIGA